MIETGITPPPRPPKKTNWAVLVFLTFVGVTIVFGVVAAIAGGPSSATPAVTSQGPAPEAPTYEHVPKATIEGLAHGLEKGLAFHPTGYMLKSRSHGNAYYVALRLLGPGMNNTWVFFLVSGTQIDAKRSSGGMAIGAVTKEFTDWPDSATTDANARITDPEVNELEGFVTKLEPDDMKASAGVVVIAGTQ
ncbi:MAG: hypothetical protein WD716_11935 [Fimbriimonadaceae bacterium]